MKNEGDALELKRGEALPPDLELNEAVLRKMGVLKDDAAEVLETLFNNGCKTGGHLNAVETKDEMEGLAGEKNKMNGRALWVFLHPRAASLSAAEVFQGKLEEISRTVAPLEAAGKPLTTLDFNYGDVSKFVSRHLLRELQDENIRKRLRLDPSSVMHETDSNAEDVIELLSPLFGKDGARDKIYVRGLMPKLVKRICDWLESDDSKSRAMILGGNRGCGKTVIGMLIVILLASKKHVVMYEHGGIMMIVAPKFEEILADEQKLLQNRFRNASVSLWQEAGAYVFNPDHAHLIAGLLQERIVFVQDVGDITREIAPELPCRRLIVTSPNAHKLRKFERIPNYRSVIVPTWSKEEIHRVHAVSPEVVDSRFERMGGIPRWVCDAEYGRAEDRQDLQIRNLSYETLRSLLQEQSYVTMTSQIDKQFDGKSTDLVIRLEPQPDDDSKVTTMITSKYVELELAYRFTEAAEFNVQAFISATEVSSTLAHFRGYVLEAFAHRALTRENALKMKVQLLTSAGVQRHGTPSEPRSALHFETTRVYQNLDLLTEVKVETYYRPKRKNEPTIDSWAVVPRSFIEEHFPDDPRLEDTTLTHFIVFFQITVSDTHVVDGTVLKRHITWAKAKLGLAQLPVVFVFLTTENGIRSMQTVTLKDKKKIRKPFDNQTQFGCQYAIMIQDGFQVLARQVKAERRSLEASTQKAYDATQEGDEEEEE